MSLTPGARLGPYEILALIGSGGMGEVYRAHDPRLGRDVAVKVLPAIFAADADRLRRFEQEARAAAALNHPNILHILDIGTDNRTAYVVSELLEGRTLRDQIEDGAVPLSKAIDCGRQIALGLAAAHAKGITHRDMKPENVFVTPDGRVKILDFGLAKLREEGGEAIATRLQNSTEAGVVLGTAGYMSPEQVRAQPVDTRSDIFSAGIVLFEMVTGTRPFKGESAAETMNAIVKEDAPDPATTNQKLPPSVSRIIRHCLEKSPAERFQSARDLAFALEALSGSQSGSNPEIAVPGSAAGSRLRGRLPWAIAGVTVVALLLALLFAIESMRRAPGETSVVRFVVTMPENTSFTINFDMHGLSVSPDGRSLAFVTSVAGKSTLWIRPLDAVEARAVPGTEGASSPFWSPDSRYIAFFAGRALRRVDPSGGSRLAICPVSENVETTGSWGSAGTILYTDKVGDQRSIYRVADTGGVPVVGLQQDGNPNWVYFLPDGKHYLFHQRGIKGDASGGTYVAALDEASPRMLARDLSSRVEYAQGHLLYVREGSLLAQAFDARSLLLSGEPSTLVEHLPYFDQTGWAEFSSSNTGVLAYMTDIPKLRVVWIDRTGREIGQIGAPGLYGEVRLSPDARKLAVVLADSQLLSGDIWIHDLSRDTPARFVFSPADESNPVWSPDAGSVAYFACCLEKSFTEQSSLHIKKIGEAGPGQGLGYAGFDIPNDWSRDGRAVLFTRSTVGTTRTQLWVLTLTDRKAHPFRETPFSDQHGRFSPDGRWVAFVSDESGRREVHVARFDQAGAGAERISIAGGKSPVWSADGKELFFLAGDDSLMSVAVTPGPKLQFAKPVLLFRNPSIAADAFDAAPDGQRFVTITGSAHTQTSPFTVVLNWPASLKR